MEAREFEYSEAGWRLDCRGAAAIFFVAVFLPIIFFVCVLGADLSRYFREAQLLQESADEITMTASKSLPYPDAAKAAAKSLAARSEWRLGDVSVRVGTKFTSAPRRYDYLDLSARSAFAPNFPRLFGINISLPLQVYSSSRPVPVDALVLFDVADYMAAPNQAPQSDAMGFSYPPAQFFEAKDPERAAHLTRQCFNERLSPAKIAGVRLLDYMTASRSNAVGLGFFPAGILGAEISKDITLSTLSEGAGEAGLSVLSDYEVSDVDCLNAALSERWALNYKIPAVDPLLIPSGSEEARGRLEIAIDLASGRVPLRAAMWGRALRAREVPQISDVLSTIAVRLLSTGPLVERGGLSELQRREVYIFLGDFPHQSGRRFPDRAAVEALETGLAEITARGAIDRRPLNINFFISRNPEQSELEFESCAADLNAIFARMLPQSSLEAARLTLRAFYITGPADYSQAFQSALSGRRFLLSR